MDIYGWIAIACVLFVVLLFAYALMKVSNDADKQSEYQFKADPRFGYQPKDNDNHNVPNPPTSGSNIYNKYKDDN